MKIVEETDRRLVLGGWKIPALFVGAVLALVPLGLIAWMLADRAWAMIFVVLFCAAICIALLRKLDFRQRIELNRDTGQITLDQLRLLGWIRRSAPFAHDARVEVDQTVSGGDGGRVAQRMVLADSERRTPFSELWHTRSFDDEAALVNCWLERTG
ncbi:hypothetical protein P1J78_07700 [Psychromarinibacter sp. C21-152]|uniref:DUF2244 domain-containing protein n=1 Tax=Psychromarinibacter sediminicola TaxID=3033385 RepID=A0AAE3T918_9RHOB|nr:hypothetical protein [Psychromarinibacter sediminicola]MDF0600609.1 hypothetical protein [Psychromarinibacter sediminicola]